MNMLVGISRTWLSIFSLTWAFISKASPTRVTSLARHLHCRCRHQILDDINYFVSVSFTLRVNERLMTYSRWYRIILSPHIADFNEGRLSSRRSSRQLPQYDNVKPPTSYLPGKWPPHHRDAHGRNSPWSPIISSRASSRYYSRIPWPAHLRNSMFPQNRSEHYASSFSRLQYWPVSPAKCYHDVLASIAHKNEGRSFRRQRKCTTISANTNELIIINFCRQGRHAVCYVMAISAILISRCKNAFPMLS